MLIALFVFALQSPVQLSPAKVAEGWGHGESIRTESLLEAPDSPVEDDLGRSFLLRANPTGEGVELCLLPISARYLERSPLHESADYAVPVLNADGAPWILPARALAGRRNLYPLAIRDERQLSLLLCEPEEERIRQIELRVESKGTAVVTRLGIFASGTKPGSFSPRWIRSDEDDHLKVRTTQGEEHFSRSHAPKPTDLMGRVRAIRSAIGHEAWKEEQWITLLKDEAPEVRAVAARTLESRLSEASAETMSALIGALKGGGEVYARQLACSLGEIAETPGGIRGLCVLMTRRAKDKWLRLAVRSGLEGEEFEMLRVLIGMRSWQENKPGRFEGTRELAADILHSRRRLEVLKLIDLALGPKRQPWHVEAIAQAFGVEEGQDPKEALRSIRAGHDFESAEIQGSFERGQAAYEESCLSCHRPSGYGYGLRSPTGRVPEGSLGLESLKNLLGAPKHEGVKAPADLSDLHRYLRMEWQPLKP